MNKMINGYSFDSLFNILMMKTLGLAHDQPIVTCDLLATCYKVVRFS